MLHNEVKASDGGGWRIRDRAWVKPETARCTSRWKIGRITREISDNYVEVDGIPRDLLDIRSVPFNGGREAGSGVSSSCERFEDERGEDDEDERGEEDAFTRGRVSVGVGRYQRQRCLPK